MDEFVNMSNDIDMSQGVEAYSVSYDNSSSPVTLPHVLFKYVKTNVPGPGLNKDTFSEQFAGCDCNGVCTVSMCSCLQLFGSAYDESGKLKVEVLQELSSRPVLECGHACSCDPEHCTNRTVQKGIKNTFYVFRTRDKGYGLMLDSRNKSEIPRLSFVCEYAGEVIGEEKAKKRIKQTDATGKDNYLIALREHVSGAETCTYIDPCHIGNVGRFINHSCDPNLFMVPVRVNHQVPRLALFARKNIKPGDELTFDYSGNAALNVTSDPITKVESDTDVPNYNCNNYLYATQVENVTHNSQPSESETDLNPPVKRLKFTTTGCSLKMTSIHSTENASYSTVNNNNHEVERDDEVTVTLKQPDNEIVACRNASCFEVDNPDTKAVAFVKRKPCFCSSSNCAGFLPLDSRLLYN